MNIVSIKKLDESSSTFLFEKLMKILWLHRVLKHYNGIKRCIKAECDCGIIEINKLIN
jgi:hypothetical protein